MKDEYRIMKYEYEKVNSKGTKFK